MAFVVYLLYMLIDNIFLRFADGIKIRYLYIYSYCNFKQSLKFCVGKQIFFVLCVTHYQTIYQTIISKSFSISKTQNLLHFYLMGQLNYCLLDISSAFQFKSVICHKYGSRMVFTGISFI